MCFFTPPSFFEDLSYDADYGEAAEKLNRFEPIIQSYTLYTHILFYILCRYASRYVFVIRHVLWIRRVPHTYSSGCYFSIFLFYYVTYLINRCLFFDPFFPHLHLRLVTYSCFSKRRYTYSIIASFSIIFRLYHIQRQIKLSYSVRLSKISNNQFLTLFCF